MSVIEQCNSCDGFTGYCPAAENNGNVCAVYEPAIDNSKMFRRIFSYKGRIRRSEFCLSYAIYLIAYMVSKLSYMANPHSSFSFLFALLSILLVIVMFLQCIKRCHDLGYSGWWSFLPLFNPLWLMFAKGDEGINEYGSDPKQIYELQIFDEEEYQRKHQTEACGQD